MNSVRLIGCLFLLLASISTAAGQVAPGKEKQAGAARPALDTGRFRVTLTGFTVNRQTADNVLEADGKGDEVYILAEVAQYDSRWVHDSERRWAGRTHEQITRSLGGYEGWNGRGNVTLRRSLTSVVMGDSNTDASRIQAGSAGGRGGLRTGDRFPTNEPWTLTGAPRPDRLPMLLWEGDLRVNSDLVLIIPTVWEWDGGNPMLRSQFAQDVNHYFSNATYDNRGLGFVWRAFEGGDIFGAGDRPVGMKTAWVPTGLMLTFETAQHAAATSPSRVGTGVVEIRYAAADEDYSLYLKVERLR